MQKKKIIVIEFKKWKSQSIKNIISLDKDSLFFVKSVSELRKLKLNSSDILCFWGAIAPDGLEEIAKSNNSKLVRIEDGFIRSVGLGSDLIPPLSLVFDHQGIYFDATRTSDLEQILNEEIFNQKELNDAIKIRETIIRFGITKYNIEPISQTKWGGVNAEKIILVPGQVETDASIYLGCTNIRKNIDLLKAVRERNPSAFIVYKPHPDVICLNRRGHIFLNEARAFADYIEKDCSIISCIDATDEVHTMTSLSGFDALLRGKKVVTYGQPFYAGWGLTEDLAVNAFAFKRRKRILTLDELVAGALLRYPTYWDNELKGYTTCESVLNKIIQQREELELNGSLEKLRTGFIRRQIRKLIVLIKTFLGR